MKILVRDFFHEFYRRSRKIFRKSKKWLSSHIGGPRAVQKNIVIIYFRAIYHDDQLTSRSGGATTDDVAACFWDLPTFALIACNLIESVNGV